MTGLSPFLERLLRDVSRSFYLTLRVLPSAIRPSIGVAYLLARATDTIADTEIIPVARRLAALQKLRECIQSGHLAPGALDEMAHNQGSTAERLLLTRLEEVMSALNRLDPADRQRVQTLLDIITSGQELDLTRFGDKHVAQVIALQTDAELDDYTYRVAGCVGEFWTHICRAHLYLHKGVTEEEVLANGVRFGKGLQLVNILRDLPADLRNGRCYLPEKPMAPFGLSPMDLLSPDSQSRFKPFYWKYLSQARTHLAAGWEYTLALPSRRVRLRLACAWPILIGVRTLDKLREINVLDPGQRVKVNRSEVRGILARTILLYPWQPVWRQLLPPEAKTS